MRPPPRSAAQRAPRLDPVLIGVVYLALGAAASVAPGATLVAAGVGLVALARRIGGAALLLAAAALGVGWGRASWLLLEHARQASAARELLVAPSRCAASGRVTGSPSDVGGSLRFDAELDSLDCAGRLDRRQWAARLYLPNPPPPSPPLPALARGDRIALIADLAPVSDFRNFDLPDPRPAAARRGAVLSGAALSLEVERAAWSLPALIDRARAHVRQRILATFGGQVAGMARALVLGENDLAPDAERAFQRSGLSHLLAVSGTHLIVAVLALVRGLEALLRRWTRLSGRADVRRPAALLGLCLGPLYADFAGGSGSAFRAAWMLCAVLGVRAIGRHVFPSRVLAASLALGWLGDGLVVFDTSFSLSIAATAGLLAMGHRLDQHVLTRAAALTEPRPTDLGRLAQALSRAALTTLAATLPCVPILLSISPGLSLASVGANLLAAPLGEAVALPLCLAHALAAPLPLLERGLALVASGALALIRGIAFASASVDWLYFAIPPPTEWHLACLTSGIITHLAATGQPWLSRAAPAASFGPSVGPAAVPGAGPSFEPGAAPGAEARTTAGAKPIARRAGSRVFAWATRWSGRLGGFRPLPGAGEGPGWVTAVACVAGLLAVEAATRWPHSAAYGRAHARLRVTALDVGQGDSTLIDLPDGRLMLIDGGGFVGIPIDPGERVILPTLRARRRDRIDILVLTHPHPDHYGGLLSVVGEVAVGEFWYGGDEGGAEASTDVPVASVAPLAGVAATAGMAASRAPAASPYRQLLERLRERGVPRRSARELCLEPMRADPTFSIRVLHPCPEVARDREPNDNSLVVHLQHGQRAALFVGDAERWAEQRLLSTHAAELGADFLKVGHHGSRSSSSADFLARVAPRFATISSGVRNRFGHPHPEALAHLEQAGAQVLRLDRRGAIQWQTDGITQSARSFIDGELEGPAQ